MASLERYCSHLQPRTVQVVTWVLSNFFDWLSENGGEFRGLNGDDLVAWQRRHMGDYALLDVVEDYVRGKEGTFEYKKRCYGAIRAFFAHNRCELPRDPTFRVQGTRPAVRGDLKVDELRRVLSASNVMYRAIFLCMFQAGMGLEELIYWDSHGLRDVQNGLKKRVGHLRVELPGRKKMKNKKPYYTFLGQDAVGALEVWFRERPSEAGTHIFCTQFLRPLGKSAVQMYWLKKLSDLGLIEKKLNGDSSNRYGKNLHELRDLFKTRWRPTGQDMELADYFMGHDIDELGYDKSPRDYADWFEEGYLNAEPWLNVLSDDPEKVSRADAERQVRELKELQDLKFEAMREEVEAIKRRIDKTG